MNKNRLRVKFLTWYLRTKHKTGKEGTELLNWKPIQSKFSNMKFRKEREWNFNIESWSIIYYSNVRMGR